MKLWDAMQRKGLGIETNLWLTTVQFVRKRQNEFLLFGVSYFSKM